MALQILRIKVLCSGLLFKAIVQGSLFHPSLRQVGNIIVYLTPVALGQKSFVGTLLHVQTIQYHNRVGRKDVGVINDPISN